MADARDGFPLKGGGGGVQRSGGAKQDVFPFAIPQAGEKKTRQHAGAAAAAGAAAVDVLTVGLEDKQTAVGVAVQGHPVPPGQLLQQLAAQTAQVAGDDQVVEAGGAAGII